MSRKFTVLPDNILRRMDPKDRAPMGKAGLTNAEADAKQIRASEKKLQDQMEAILRLRGLFFIRSRMDKKTTVRKGLFDFWIVLPGGHHVAVEAKIAKGRVSEEQRQVFFDYEMMTGEPVHILRTLDEFRAVLDKKFEEISSG